MTGVCRHSRIKIFATGMTAHTGRVFKDQTEIRMLKSHDRVLTCHVLLAIDFQSIRVRGRVEEVIEDQEDKG